MAARERSNSLKDRLAYEAARILVEQKQTDFDRARRKAAERLGLLNRRHWPSNEDIQAALVTQRRLFAAPKLVSDCQELWSQALEAMRIFETFEPRLVGDALHGMGDRQNGVQLFLFADRPEDVMFELLEHRIPWQEGERMFRYAGGRRRQHPVFRFLAGDIPFELIVLPPLARRDPPLDPVTERPQAGADLQAVERMLADADSSYRFEMGK